MHPLLLGKEGGRGRSDSGNGKQDRRTSHISHTH